MALTTSSKLHREHQLKTILTDVAPSFQDTRQRTLHAPTMNYFTAQHRCRGVKLILYTLLLQTLNPRVLINSLPLFNQQLSINTSVHLHIIHRHQQKNVIVFFLCRHHRCSIMCIYQRILRINVSNPTASFFQAFISGYTTCLHPSLRISRHVI